MMSDVTAIELAETTRGTGMSTPAATKPTGL